ncbi:MAG TPA: MFS transporter [Conexibacter sp.]|jgi:predicted MFS family arabinose efflux permease
MSNRLDRRLVALMAFACGAAVANLYYAQPLLDTIADKLHTSQGIAGLIVTATQIGYAAGLLLVVPRGDIVDRRHLITRLLLVCAAALGVAAASPNVAVLAVALTAVGITSVVAQVLVPFAGDLASDEERGKVVGMVISGLLTGILSARILSGIIADLAGWRTVYVVAAVLMVALALTLRRVLPEMAVRSTARYGELLHSVGTLVRTEPVLRLRMAYGIFGMLTFTLLWTALTFLLSGAPYNYSDATIGIFGLAGLMGATVAQGAGRLVDRGLANIATACFWALVLVGWVLIDIGGTVLIPLIVGLLVLDAGVQGQHITNQSLIFQLRPEARSRLTTAYMTGNFIAAAIGSALASALWGLGGWGLVSGVGLGSSTAALIVWLASQRAVRRYQAEAAVAGAGRVDGSSSAAGDGAGSVGAAGPVGAR